jgi:hypothetical protein
VGHFHRASASANDGAEQTGPTQALVCIQSRKNVSNALVFDARDTTAVRIAVVLCDLDFEGEASAKVAKECARPATLACREV